MKSDSDYIYMGNSNSSNLVILIGMFAIYLTVVSNHKQNYSHLEEQYLLHYSNENTCLFTVNITKIFDDMS